MFKALSAFLSFCFIMLALKWFIPIEAQNIASEILLMILNMIKDLLENIPLNQ
jgi:hypothetical protein